MQTSSGGFRGWDHRTSTGAAKNKKKALHNNVFLAQDLLCCSAFWPPDPVRLRSNLPLQLDFLKWLFEVRLGGFRWAHRTEQLTLCVAEVSFRLFFFFSQGFWLGYSGSVNEDNNKKSKNWCIHDGKVGTWGGGGKEMCSPCVSTEAWGSNLCHGREKSACYFKYMTRKSNRRWALTRTLRYFLMVIHASTKPHLMKFPANSFFQHLVEVITDFICKRSKT